MSTTKQQPQLPDRATSSSTSINKENGNDSEGSGKTARYCGKNQRNRPNQQNSQRHFKGKHPDLEGHIYDTGLPNSNNDLFSKTTKEIAKYVASNIDGAGDYCLATENLQLPALQEPDEPEQIEDIPPSWAERVRYKQSYAEYIKKKNKWTQNEAKIFPIILGQCSRVIRDRLEAHAQWTTINADSDVMELLKLIQQSMYVKSTKRHPTHALIEAEFALHKFRQGD